MTTTTRFGKVRTASQRRFILVGSQQGPGRDPKPWVEGRSDTADTLHARARRKASWDIGHECWVNRNAGFPYHYVVVDTVTGREVHRP